jgi:hypothetical protein
VHDAPAVQSGRLTSARLPRKRAATAVPREAPGRPSRTGSPTPRNGFEAFDDLANARSDFSDDTDGGIVTAYSTPSQLAARWSAIAFPERGGAFVTRTPIGSPSRSQRGLPRKAKP